MDAILRKFAMANTVSLTERLNSYMNGDMAAADALLRELLPKLHEIAVRELKRERYMAPLSKTELIHEVWLSNLSKGGWQIRDQGHFYALASLAMRRVLVDLARRRLAACRGGGEAVLPLDHSSGVLDRAADDLQQIVEIGIIMERLEAKDSDAARVVDMHYFSGFTLEEIAHETGLTLRQVRLRWERGVKRLKRTLYSTPPGSRSDLPAPSA
jgi:RNA polymerase sigma factor (TIGR02999 family)